MSDIQLDQGAIQRIYQNQAEGGVILQVVDLKKITTTNNVDRFRVVLSDGVQYMQGMLASQISDLVTSGQLNKHSVVRVDDFVTNTIQGRKLCIVVKATVLQHVAQQIGQPTNVAQAGAPPPSSQPSQQPGHPHQHASMPPPAPAAPVNRGPPPPAPSGYGQPPAPARPQYQARPPQQQRQPGGFPGSNRAGYGGGASGGYGAPPRGGGGDERYQPVSSLNPYQSGWRIKVRVTAKDPIRHYKNARGEGKVFSIDLLDKEGGEIRATMFNDAVDQFYSMLHKDKVYLISGGQIKMARKRFTHIKNDYAITLNRDASVVQVDEDAAIQRQVFAFVPIGSLAQLEPNTFADVVGIVAEVSTMSDIMSQKMQRTLQKRTLQLVDRSGKVEVTLWNQQAEEFDEQKLQGNPVVALKAAKISDFGGRSLSANQVELWPQLPESTELHQWWQGGGQHQVGSLQSLTVAGQGSGAPAPRMTFREAEEQNLGVGDPKGAYFSVLATITNINHSTDRLPWYKSAPDKDVNAKVEDAGDGKWYCAKNNRTYDSYEPRYILRMQVADHTGSQWMSAFNDASQVILGGKPAADLERCVLDNRIHEFEQAFSDANFQRYVFRCRAKEDTWQDERRIRYDVVGLQPANLQQEATLLLDKIRQLEQARTM